MDSVFDWVGFLSRGLITTLALAGAAAVLTVILAAVLALIRIGPSRPLRILARVQVDFFRSVPLLALLIFMYFGLGPLVTDFGFTAFWLAVVALTLSESAYLGEVYRAALESIPPTQWEAARSLGMGWRQIVRRVVIPQAVLPSIPATVNILVAIMKDSALASLIAVGELTLTATILTSLTFKPMEVYVVVALMYLAVIVPVSLIAIYSERLVERHVGLRIRVGLAEIALPPPADLAPPPFEQEGER